MQTMAHINGLTVRDAPIVSGGPPIPQPLLIDPGIYSYNGIAYDMTQAGLYRFAAPFTPDQGHRVVRTDDVEAFINALSGICIHGTRDKGLSNSTKTHRARTDWLRMTCGDQVSWIASHLTALEIPSRAISTVTMGKSDNYNDGHMMLEAWIGGGWRLYDVDWNRRFISAVTGQRINAADIAETVKAGTAQEVETVLGPRYDTTSGEVNPWLFSSDYDSPSQRRKWAERIIQAVGVWHTDGLCYFKIPIGSEHRKDWLLSLSSKWRVMDDHAAWHEAFYP